MLSECVPREWRHWQQLSYRNIANTCKHWSYENGKSCLILVQFAIILIRGLEYFESSLTEPHLPPQRRVPKAIDMLWISEQCWKMWHMIWAWMYSYSMEDSEDYMKTATGTICHTEPLRVFRYVLRSVRTCNTCLLGNAFGLDRNLSTRNKNREFLQSHLNSTVWKWTDQPLSFVQTFITVCTSNPCR